MLVYSPHDDHHYHKTRHRPQIIVDEGRKLLHYHHIVRIFTYIHHTHSKKNRAKSTILAGA